MKSAGRVLLWSGALLLLALLVLPIAGLVARGLPAVLAGGLANPLLLKAIAVSISTSLAALFFILLLGTPLAWILARSRKPALGAVELFVQLPIALPPSLAGLALLFAFGHRGLLGGVLARLGLSLAFSPAAVITAQIFVAAPYYVQAATSAFRGIDERLLDLARTLGCSPARAFFRVAFPLSLGALRGGALLAWARALGEFGATLLFAGNLSGVTQTLPLAIYSALESDVHIAAALGLLLLAIAVVLLLLARRTVASLFAVRGALR